MPLKAFVSSTFEDLKDHRAHVIRVLRGGGIHVDPMEDWGASASEPKHFSVARLHGCDLCVLLVARRRGYLPPGSNRSITQMEYDEAIKRGLTVMVYLLDDDSLWHTHLDERATDPSLADWLVKLRERHGVRFFDHAPGSVKVGEDVARWLQERSSSPTVDLLSVMSPRPLPRPSGRTIGREGETKELSELLATDHVHLVTLLGPGGIGKTHLALQIGNNLATAFQGRVHFVDLSEQQTIAGLSNAIAEAIGSRLTSSGAPERIIANVLSTWPTGLLVLDNYEQLAAFAEETVGFWIRSVPGCRFLVTSRTMLQLDGEVVYDLDSFAEPEIAAGMLDETALSALRMNPAVALFEEKAHATDRKFQVNAANVGDIVRICRELQCHPLSIVLVAERVRMFTPAQIAVRLREKLSFVRSSKTNLWETIDWSYQLLSDSEKAVFRQASIFRDGFGIDAIPEVFSLNESGGGDVFDILDSLCRQSLLRSTVSVSGEKRFDMLKVIQEFGQAQWQRVEDKLTPPSDLFTRWSRHYVSLAEYWASRIRTPQCREAMDRLAAERENVLGVQEQALLLGQSEMAGRAILAYASALAVRGPAALRAPRLQQSIDAVGKEFLGLRCRLLVELSDALWATGQWHQAGDRIDEAVAIAESLADPPALAWALAEQARIKGSLDEVPIEIKLKIYERAERIFRDLHDFGSVAGCLTGMGDAFFRAGQFDLAEAKFRASSELSRSAGDLMGEARCLNSYGKMLRNTAQPDRAARQFEEAARINRGLDDKLYLAGNITNWGMALTDLDKFDEAFTLFETAGKLHSALGNHAWGAVNLGAKARALLMCKRLDEALACVCQAQHIAEEVGHKEDVALHAENRGRILQELGRQEEAVGYLQESCEIREQIGEVSIPRYFGGLVRLAKAEAELGRPARASHAVLLAAGLATRLRLTHTHPVRWVRDDIELLSNLQERLRFNS